MNRQELPALFNKRPRIGSLATANRKGEVNAAVFGSPQMIDENTVVMGIGRKSPLPPIRKKAVAERLEAPCWGVSSTITSTTSDGRGAKGEARRQEATTVAGVEPGSLTRTWPSLRVPGVDWFAVETQEKPSKSKAGPPVR